MNISVWGSPQPLKNGFSRISGGLYGEVKHGGAGTFISIVGWRVEHNWVYNAGLCNPAMQVRRNEVKKHFKDGTLPEEMYTTLCVYCRHTMGQLVYIIVELIPKYGHATSEEFYYTVHSEL